VCAGRLSIELGWNAGPFHSPDRRLEIDFKFKIPDSRKEPIASLPALLNLESGIWNRFGSRSDKKAESETALVWNE
jgi:hypothetical protein